jgi:GTP-binding protein Era
LNVRIVDVALTAIGDVDLILIIVDASQADTESEAFMIEKLKEQKRPVLLALNKIDLVEKPRLLKLIDDWTRAYDFKAIVPISARHGQQVEDLIVAMEGLLPQGPPFFPEDTLTDVPEKFIAAEMIREKVFRLTGQEIPYSTAVTIDSFKETKKGALVKIYATIHIERDSQKGIIIGKQGAKLKQIGEASRKEIERMLAARVFLKLFVRVQKNWSKDTRALRKFGY